MVFDLCLPYLVKLAIDDIEGLNQSFLISTFQELSLLDEFGAMVVVCEMRSNNTHDPTIKIGQQIVPVLIVHPALYDRLPDKTGVLPMTKEMVYHSLTNSIWVPHDNSLYKVKSLSIENPQVHLWFASMLPFITPRQLQQSDVRIEQLENNGRYTDEEYGELPFTGTAFRFKPKDLGLPKSAVVDDPIIGWVPALANVTVPPSSVPPSPTVQISPSTTAAPHIANSSSDETDYPDIPDLPHAHGTGINSNNDNSSISVSTPHDSEKENKAYKNMVTNQLNRLSFFNSNLYQYHDQLLQQIDQEHPFPQRAPLTQLNNSDTRPLPTPLQNKDVINHGMAPIFEGTENGSNDNVLNEDVSNEKLTGNNLSRDNLTNEDLSDEQSSDEQLSPEDLAEIRADIGLSLAIYRHDTDLVTSKM